jgi:hypothetical protein
MPTPKIKSKAVLIGFNVDRACVYSEILDISEYYDGEHVWDNTASVKKLKLVRLLGYLFDPNGILDQEFETHFDSKTGAYKSSRCRYSSGVVQEHSAE